MDIRKSRISQRLDIRRFLRYLTQIRDSFLNHPPDVEQTRRVYIIFFSSILVIITLVPFGMIALAKKNYTVGTFDLALALILTVILYTLVAIETTTIISGTHHL